MIMAIWPLGVRGSLRHYRERCVAMITNTARLAGGAGRHGGDAAVDVLLGGVPAADADPHRGAAPPHGRPAPAGPLVLDGRDDRAGPRGVTEVHEDLVEHDIVGHGAARAAH